MKNFGTDNFYPTVSKVEENWQRARSGFKDYSSSWKLLKIYDSRNVGELVEGTKKFEVTAVVQKTNLVDGTVVTFRCDYTPTVYVGVTCEVYQTSLPNGKKCFRRSMSARDRGSVITMVAENWRKVTNLREVYLKQNPNEPRTKYDLPTDENELKELT